MPFRSPRLALDAVPRAWLGRRLAATQVANALHVLFPAGERFFVRSVARFRAAVDPRLAEQVKDFCRQEAQHARAHERFFDNLRAAGHDVDAIVADFERFAFEWLEPRLSPAMRLSVTAAAEHFTALFAVDALSRDFLDDADPEMARLLAWHAVEELEHKAVAFDVLRTVAPGYVRRVAGLVLASLGLTVSWARAARALLARDGLGLRDGVRALRDPSVTPLVDDRTMLRGLAAYLRPGFHPDDVDHGPLVAATLARLEATGMFEARGAAE